MNNFSFYKDGKAFYCLFFLVFFLSFPPVSANSIERHGLSFFQQHQVQGTITDGVSPLPGVTITVKSKLKSSTISDFTGQYSLLVSPNDTLVVSFMGFKTALVPVNGRTTVNVKLSFDTTTLQEVRVNAGYYSVKESERTGSIARITSKDIENQPVTNVLATIQGRMAGVSITQTTGVPGGGFDIKIRGQNSLRTDANAPLYIIDGMPYSSDPIGYNQTSTSFPTVTSPLNSINPDTIESIEILKDADATAIYGSRGANGVVLITTKKGKAGKTNFTINASTGAGTVTKFTRLMNTEQYLAMRYKAFTNDGITTYPQSAFDVNGSWDKNRYTDWQKELIGGTAAITDLKANLSGGSKNTQFLVSGSYNTQSTVFPGRFLYRKAGAQFNLNHRSEDGKFNLVLTTGYGIQNNNQPSADLTSSSKYLAPNAPALYDADGNLNWANNTWLNPLRNLVAEFRSNTKDLVSSTTLSYEILPDLTIKSNFGYSDLQNIETRINPSTIYNPASGATSALSALYLNNTQRNSWIVEPQINWEINLGTSKIGVILGSTFQNQNTSRLFQSGVGFTSNSLIYNLASATTSRILFSEDIQYKYQAFFGRINYNLLDRYFINLTGRRDGSSRFGPGNQFANFGAIGAAWLFSKENLLNKSAFLSFGKLRASYGTTGNDQIGDYQFFDTYTSTGVLYDGSVGLQPSRLFNPNFGWETNKKLEIALETGFLQDRIFFTSAWYQNRSSNQLVGIPLAATTGFSTMQANLNATVENAGWEFTLRTNNFNGLNFKWTTTFNLSLSRNKLLDFPNLNSSTYREMYRLGQPLNIQLLYQYKGIDPQTGLYQFTDINNDGKITNPEDKQIIADLNPKYFGGLQNELKYKNWNLQFLFQFVKQMNRIAPMEFPGQMANQPLRVTDGWEPGNTSASYQIYTAGYNNQAVTANSLRNQSTASIEDVSFIRLKNISLSYQLPLNLQSVKCQVMLQGQNLLTFTKFKDGDPEFITYGFLPPLKIITSGIQLTF
jgi:TonB-linked SusC/RagA family outer membrane protein